MGTEEVPVLAHWRYPITYVSEGRHTTNMDRGRTHIFASADKHNMYTGLLSFGGISGKSR